MRYDSIIVGGGMAGLTAASYLSKAGKKTLLIERSFKTGGLVNSFERDGFLLDGGIRSIEDSGIVDPFLRQLGIEVEFLESPVTLGIEDQVYQIDPKNPLEPYRDLLKSKYPSQSKEIDDILKEIKKIMSYTDVLYGIDNPLFLDVKKDRDYFIKKITPWLFKFLWTYPKITKRHEAVETYLRKFTQDDSLIDIIAQHFFKNTPAFFALSYFSLYLDYRYPKGGTGVFPQTLDRFIRERGGEILLETEIVSVDVENQSVTDASGKTYEYQELVWAADQKLLYRLVDESKIQSPQVLENVRARRTEIADKVGGDSIYTCYLEVDLPVEWFQAKTSGHLFYTPKRKGQSFVTNRFEEVLQRGEKDEITSWIQDYLEYTTYEVSIPAIRDKSAAPAGKTALIVSTLFEYRLAKYLETSGISPTWRDQVEAKMIEVLDQSIFQGIQQKIDKSFSSTPVTIEKWTGNSEGAITGWAFTNSKVPAVSSFTKITKSVLTPIPHVTHCGQWSYSPAGLPISIMTGKIAADETLKRLKKQTH